MSKITLHDAEDGSVVGEYEVPDEVLTAANTLADWLQAQPEGVRYTLRLAGLQLED